MINKLKLAFDIEDTWNYETFRELIHILLTEDDDFEVYLITLSTNTEYVNSIVTNMAIDPNNVYQETSDINIITRLNTLGIQIYLEADNELVEQVNETSTTPTRAILVNSIPDRYRLQPMYITNLEFWTNQIKNAV